MAASTWECARAGTSAWAEGVGEIALFGSFTNLIGQANVLNYARNPSTAETAAIEMRSRSPLVVGLDWRY